MAPTETSSLLNPPQLVEGRSETDVYAQARKLFPEGYRIISGPTESTEGGISGFFAKRKVTLMVASRGAGSLAALPPETAVAGRSADDEVVELSAAGLRRAEETRSPSGAAPLPSPEPQPAPVEPTLEDVQIGEPQEERAPVYAELPAASTYADVLPDERDLMDRESARDVLRRHGLLPEPEATPEPRAELKVEPFVVPTVEEPPAPEPAPEPVVAPAAPVAPVREEAPVLRVIPAPSAEAPQPAPAPAAAPTAPAGTPVVPAEPAAARWQAVAHELEQEGFAPARADELVREGRAFSSGDEKSSVRDALARRLKQVPPALLQSRSMIVVGDRGSGKSLLSYSLVKMLHGNGVRVAVAAVSPVGDPGSARLMQLAVELEIPYGWTDNPADTLLRSLGRHAEMLVVDMHDGNLTVPKLREQVKRLRSTLPGRSSLVAAVPADRNAETLADQLRSYPSLGAIALTSSGSPANRGALAELALDEKTPFVFACDGTTTRTLDPNSLAALLVP